MKGLQHDEFLQTTHLFMYSMLESDAIHAITTPNALIANSIQGHPYAPFERSDQLAKVFLIRTSNPNLPHHLHHLYHQSPNLMTKYHFVILCPFFELGLQLKCQQDLRVARQVYFLFPPI